MTEVEAILIEALAQADALHEPIRNPGTAAYRATWVLRGRYGSQGLPYRGSGDKNRERDLRAAVAQDLVVRRRARQKTIGIRLTRRGLCVAWSLVGLHPFGDAVALADVLRHGPAGAWIPETAFTGGIGWGDGRQAELASVAVAHRQALAAGHIEGHCDSRGRVAYRSLVSMPEGLPADWKDQAAPDPDEEAVELYGRTYAESLTWLDASTPEALDARGEIGRIPLSTSEFHRGALAHA